ncbi:MAG: MaoC family dehydratase N-terminal domain-containing protein [Elusimicrobia bacterium]|nr:MaoC family dehydratase N-terminal domain-containing protein [Elusimicrobiota bacterium]
MTLYFEEFKLGQSFRSPESKPFTAGSIEAFAELSGDKNAIHVDEEFARRTPFGQRIAHGLFGLSIASGLLHELGIVRESILAFAALDWKFRGPVRVGDRLVLEAAVARLRSLGAKGGAVVFDASLVAQDGRTVQQGSWTLLVRRRPG